MGKAYQTYNPATGEVLKQFPEATDAQVQQALATAHTTFQNNWRFKSVSDRARIVSRAAALLREKVDELAGYVTLEMGKLIDQSRYEVELSADILEYYARHAEQFLKDQTVPETPNAVLAAEPIGVLVAVEPWNFPYYQLARVAGPQLVTGNVVMVKHARNVPQCAAAFARVLSEAGAPEGAYTNLYANFTQVEGLIDDFRVRGVTLTGSERAGRSVAERAGKQLKKVVLELGGSDPFIVLEDADLDHAVKQGILGRLRVMGQECTSSKRFVIVGKDRAQKFTDGITKELSSLKAGDPADSSTSLGPVVSEQALTTLLDQVSTAKEHGARVVLGGKRIDRPGAYFEPTVITDITPENPLYQQETFGPITQIYVVESEDEAIALANATKFGLGASVFSRDIEHAKAVARRIDSGMVFINSPAIFAPELPFGGVKNSGFGRELGELGIGEFVNRKLIRVA